MYHIKNIIKIFCGIWSYFHNFLRNAPKIEK
jgi:hypothetical protein